MNARVDTDLNSFQSVQINSSNYHPRTKFGQGNVFTPVCHSVHRGFCIWEGGILHPEGSVPGGVGRPPPILQDTANVRAVCILLECILVEWNFFFCVWLFFALGTHYATSIICNVFKHIVFSWGIHDLHVSLPFLQCISLCPFTLQQTKQMPIYTEDRLPLYFMQPYHGHNKLKTIHKQSILISLKIKIF